MLILYITNKQILYISFLTYLVGCTSLIQCPILYSAKEHVQKRYFGKFNTSWCTKIKHFLEDQNIFHPTGSVFCGEAQLDFSTSMRRSLGSISRNASSLQQTTVDPVKLEN